MKTRTHAIENLTPEQHAQLFEQARRRAERLRQEAIRDFFAALWRGWRDAGTPSRQGGRPSAGSALHAAPCRP
jgi:hypothetical protein